MTARSVPKTMLADLELSVLVAVRRFGQPLQNTLIRAQKQRAVGTIRNNFKGLKASKATPHSFILFLHQLCAEGGLSSVSQM